MPEITARPVLALAAAIEIPEPEFDMRPADVKFTAPPTAHWSVASFADVSLTPDVCPLPDDLYLQPAEMSVRLNFHIAQKYSDDEPEVLRMLKFGSQAFAMCFQNMGAPLLVPPSNRPTVNDAFEVGDRTTHSALSNVELTAIAVPFV